MKTYVVGRDREVLEWTIRKLGMPITSAYVCLGIVNGNPAGPLIGGVVFSDFTGTNVEITIYTPGLMRHRNLIRDCYRYAFDHLGVLRLSCRCRRDNVVMRKLYKRLGFAFEGTQKQYFGPARADDALLHVLTRDNAKKWMD